MLQACGKPEPLALELGATGPERRTRPAEVCDREYRARCFGSLSITAICSRPSQATSGWPSKCHTSTPSPTTRRTRAMISVVSAANGSMPSDSSTSTSTPRSRVRRRRRGNGVRSSSRARPSMIRSMSIGPSPVSTARARPGFRASNGAGKAARPADPRLWPAVDRAAHRSSSSTLRPRDRARCRFRSAARKSRTRRVAAHAQYERDDGDGAYDDCRTLDQRQRQQPRRSTRNNDEHQAPHPPRPGPQPAAESVLPASEPPNEPRVSEPRREPPASNAPEEPTESREGGSRLGSRPGIRHRRHFLFAVHVLVRVAEHQLADSGERLRVARVARFAHVAPRSASP